MESMLRDLPFWDDLTKAEQETVAGSMQKKHYPAGSVIHSREQACLGLIFVVSGEARTFMLSEEGREITLYRLSPGDMDVLSASCVLSQITFETQLVADTDCTLYVLPAVTLSALKDENIHVRCFIFEKLGNRFSDVMHGMQRILFTRVDVRIAEYLRDTVRETGSATVHITHEQLAREINSSREVITRILKQFEKTGAIKAGRGRIEVLEASLLPS